MLQTLSAAAAFPGLSGTNPNTPLGPTYFLGILCDFLIFRCIFRPTFLPKLNRGRSPGCGVFPPAASINLCHAHVTPWLFPGFMRCLQPHNPLILPLLHPQTSLPFFFIFFRLFGVFFCGQRVFEQPELGSISDLDFGMGAGMQTGTLVPGLDKNGGLEGGRFTPYSCIYLDPGKLCKPGSK